MRKKRLPINRNRIRKLPSETIPLPTISDIMTMASRPRFPKGPWFRGKLTHDVGPPSVLYCMMGEDEDGFRHLYGVSTIIHDGTPYREISFRDAWKPCWESVMNVNVRRRK
jgi:hypothetical protein